MVYFGVKTYSFTLKMVIYAVLCTNTNRIELILIAVHLYLTIFNMGVVLWLCVAVKPIIGVVGCTS
jgi:hypothetical protein